MSNTDVVVTGLGATTPLGGDVASTWDAMLAGRSGVSALTQEWAGQLPVRIAAELAVEPSAVIDRVKLRRLDRSEAIAIVAAQQAWADAGLADSGLDPERPASIASQVDATSPPSGVVAPSPVTTTSVRAMTTSKVVRHGWWLLLGGRRVARPALERAALMSRVR